MMLINIQKVKNDDKNFSKLAEVIQAFAKFDDVVEVMGTPDFFDESGYTRDRVLITIVTKDDIDEKNSKEIVARSIDYEEKFPNFCISLSCSRYKEAGTTLWSR